MKITAGKLARLYADKFYDTSLSLPTRLRYLVKLKGFKIGVIVSAIGVSFAALIAGLIEAFTPSANVVLKKAVVPVVKKAGNVIVPIVKNVYDNIGTFVKKIIDFVKKIIVYIGAFLFGIGKKCYGIFIRTYYYFNWSYSLDDIVDSDDQI